MSPLIKLPSQCRILIVDDENSVCELLQHTLEAHYEVTTCTTGKQACDLLERSDFDIVVTDLRLPDLSGIDVLSFAKSKDEYTEVLIITGYASVESVSVAVNLGASSYIEKPVSPTDFLVMVEKAVASRLFHLKSLSLIRSMKSSGAMAPEFKDHLSDITALYYFTRKLTLSLEVSELMRITLEETIRKSGALIVAVAVNVLGFREIYSMSASGTADPDAVKELFLDHWEGAFSFIDKERFREGAISWVFYKGKQGTPPAIGTLYPASVPMVVTGASIGTIVVFFESNEAEALRENYFLYIISSIVSPLIERGYAMLQARQLSKTDGLTGIANHRSFHEALDREIARANRHEGGFALLIMDIDNFKRINDTYGHLVGDAVLKDLTLRVGENIRTADVFARYGGEEFGLILPQTDRRGAEVLAQRIRSAIIAKSFTYARYSIPYTVSMGLTIYNSERQVKKDALIERADTALYTAKRTGKNRISISVAGL